MSDTATRDSDVLRSLWANVSTVCVSPPTPGELNKECFLMEMPGFSVDPDAFDPLKFNPATMMSPECAIASLCDRVPALARFFYDTGDHISSYWKVLLDTFTIESDSEKNAELKARYDEAIEVLYGSLDGYINQQKTPLFLSLDKLREQWEAAKKKKDYFEKIMRKGEKNPFNNAVEEAYTEYENLKLKIQNYKATILAYNVKDLYSILLEQASSEKLFMIHVGAELRVLHGLYKSKNISSKMD